MGATEIILIVIGVAIFLLGYLMPARKKDLDEEVQLISEDEIRKLIAGEADHIKDKIADIVDETVSYSIEKTERAMERLTNEKIMAINEYSDTVLEEIHKNHKEVVFLYDMLNDKHDNLTATVSEATATSDGVKQTLKDAEVTVHEAMDKADEVLRAVDEASARIQDVLRAADDAVKGVWDAQNAARVAREAAQEAIRIASELTEGSAVNRAEKAEAVADTHDLYDALADADADAGETVEEQAPAQKKAAVQTEEETVSNEFNPIIPKRVEIIHEPDEEADEDDGQDMPTSAAFASMGIFAPKSEAEKAPRRRFGIRRGVGEGSVGNHETDTAGETAPATDLQFDKDNGRNSNDRILDLHKAGKSNIAIAKELGLGLGEVKLVIDLFEGV